MLERDEMSDEEMVAHLARCQIDPAAPRSSIETLLHAFIPAPHVHHTHPDGINVLAGTRDGERLVGRVLRRSGSMDSGYIRPGFTLAKQVGARRSRGTRHLKLVVLAKHGLVVWGDTAEGAYKRTIEVIQPGRRLRQCEDRGRSRGSTARSCARRSDRDAVLLRGAAGTEGRGVERAPQGIGRRHVGERGARVRPHRTTAPQLTDVGAACPDHLVHTKRLPMWVGFDPAIGGCGDASRTGA